MMSFKRLVGQLHLWLGLITGLVIFIIALTGAVYSFAPELQKITQAYTTVPEDDKNFLPPSRIKKIAEARLPGKSPLRIYYGRRNQAVVVWFSKNDAYDYSLFLNPYSGEVLKVRDNYQDFLSIVLKIHRTLLLPFGHEIIRWSTLIFLLMLVSGIILWWPKHKRTAKHGLVVKWKASPKRLNYDLHKVLGFYASWIVIFTVVTGLIWTFGRFADFTYKITGADHSIVQKKPPVSDTTANMLSEVAPIDLVWKIVEPDLHRKYARALFVLPAAKNAPILLRGNPDVETLYKTDFRYFDQYTGREIPGAYVWGKYQDAHTVADNIKRMNYDIHTGAIFGLPGRIALFFAALIVASLPITGFYFWWGKYKTQNKRARKNVAEAAFAN